MHKLNGTSPIHIPRTHSHLRWNNALPPVATVPSGTILSFDLLDGGGSQITPTSTIADVANFNTSIADPAHGPIYVADAEPGDVLRIDFLTFETATYGWTAIIPNFGILCDEFPEPALKIWDLERDPHYAYLNERIRVPKRPFLGVVGVALSAVGEFPTIPPYETGGNIDTRHITQGSSLYLPVQVPGALFSCGDGHAAQGDGEVCGTAIETPMKCTLRLTVEKNKPWVKSPHYVTPSEEERKKLEPPDLVHKGEYGVLGIDADLREATRKAVRSMIDWLVKEKGLASREEAYMLVSVGGDLKLAEVVDVPHYAVACVMPLNVFVE